MLPVAFATVIRSFTRRASACRERSETYTTETTDGGPRETAVIRPDPFYVSRSRRVLFEERRGQDVPHIWEGE